MYRKVEPEWITEVGKLIFKLTANEYFLLITEWEEASLTPLFFKILTLFSEGCPSINLRKKSLTYLQLIIRKKITARLFFETSTCRTSISH